MSQLDTLQRDNREKALKIAELQGTIRKLTSQLKQKDQQVQSLQSLLKERAHKITRLNTEFLKLEDELVGLRKIKHAFAEQQDTIEELKQIITLQAEQISTYLSEQQTYVKFVEDMYLSNQGWFEERGLLYEYKAELERQVNEVEDVNEALIVRAQQYESELQQQNEQGNDLLGQIQYMIECCEGVE